MEKIDGDDRHGAPVIQGADGHELLEKFRARPFPQVAGTVE